MRNVSLKTAIVVTFLLVMAIPLWLAWTWPRHQAYMAERNAVESRHLVIAKTIRAALERYEADVSKIFDYFAVELDMAHDAHIEAAQGMLDGFGFRHICRFEIESGALLASAALPGLPCPVAVPDDKVEMLHTEAREDEVTFSPVMLTSDGQPAVFVMRRTGDEVTVGALTTEYFRSLGKTVVFGELGHAAIVDRTGHVLSHPKDEWLVPPKDLSGVSVVQAMMLGGSGTDEFFSPAMNLQMVAGYASMESTGWGVMVPQPVQELQALADNVRAATVWTLIIAVGVATLLALLAAHVLVEPLRSIRTRAEQLGTGSGDSMIVPAGIATRLTEFDDLRAAFNAMVLRVRTAQRTEVEARRDAQEANRTKSRFLANMSHELRTPLNAIIGFAQITRRRLKENHADRDREDEYLGYIDQSGQHLLALIDDLLDLSKIEAGARVLEEEEVSVQTIINDVHALVATTAQEKMHTIDRLLPLPADLKIKADPRAVRQMLQNLASNAVRYTDPGGLISISAELHRSGCVVLAVSDNGPGIPEDERKNVLRPFARGKVIERSAMQGTGLGLNIVEALSELHGAKLELLSREGGGTVARITFPAFRTILEPEADAPRKRTSRAARKPRAHSA